MGTRTLWRTAVAAIALGLAATACGTTAEDGGDEGGGAAAEGPISGLSVIVPNSPGSGYDTTARTWAKVLEDIDLASNVEITNVEGAGGTVGLQRVVNESGNEDLLLQMGLGVVGSTYTNQAEATLQETTPVARLIEEAEAIVVPKGSPYQTFDALVAAWQANPGSIPVGGASSPGGPDHLTPMLLAQEVGVSPRDVNYVAYDGGGELLAGLLGAKVAFGATGVGEVAEQAAAGEVTILAVTSESPVEGVDAPTLTEEGVDLVFTNWRGVVAPPGISEERAAQWISVMTEMHDSQEWKDALATNGWTDAFITGEEYATFLQEESDRVAAVLKELGLA
jgi:putative tricarboxylic transport membrane protein